MAQYHIPFDTKFHLGKFTQKYSLRHYKIEVLTTRMCGSWLNKIQHSYRMDTMHPLKEADIYILKIHCLLKKQAENSISIIRCEERKRGLTCIGVKTEYLCKDARSRTIERLPSEEGGRKRQDWRQADFNTLCSECYACAYSNNSKFFFFFFL